MKYFHIKQYGNEQVKGPNDETAYINYEKMQRSVSILHWLLYFIISRNVE